MRVDLLIVAAVVVLAWRRRVPAGTVETEVVWLNPATGEWEALPN
jgi:hypothetical protein